MSEPFGAGEVLERLPGTGSVLDLGCGSGRLTTALADRGWQATGIDTSEGQLRRARKRTEQVDWRLADMDEPLDWPAETFDAVVSRCALMIARDPAATLREARRVLRPGGRVVTAVWATPDRNLWFAGPRAAVGDALGPERAAFARHFGRLGSEQELERVHADAGFERVEVAVVADTVPFTSAADHWAALCSQIGHFRRLDATLTTDERKRVLSALAERLQPPISRTQLIAQGE